MQYLCMKVLFGVNGKFTKNGGGSGQYTELLQKYPVCSNVMYHNVTEYFTPLACKCV